MTEPTRMDRTEGTDPALVSTYRSSLGRTVSSLWSEGWLVKGVLLIYLVLAVVYAQARILHSDCSYQLYHIVNGRSIFVQEQRYGMFLTELPVLFGVYLRAPMSVLVLLYSVGLASAYGACILVTRRVFRSPVAAMAIMLSLLVGVGATFFHATTETHFLLALSGTLYGALEWAGRRLGSAGRLLVVALLTVWCMFTHPNALFTVGFVAGAALLTKRVKPWVSIGVVGIGIGYFILRMLTLSSGSYDDRLYDTLLEQSENLSRFWDLFPIWFIRQYLENEYAAVVVMLITLFAFTRPWRMLLFTIISAGVFWAITILTFHDGGGEAMMEKAFMPGIFMLALPFADLCHGHRRGRLITCLALILCLQGFWNILSHGRSYVERLDAMEGIMRTHGDANSKMLVSEEDMRGTALQFSEWGTAVDALMLSHCIDMPGLTIYLERPYQQEVQQAMHDPDLFLYLPWAPIDTTKRDPLYFDLPREPYRLVEVDLPQRRGRFSED